jgi:hypothetical protein
MAFDPRDPDAALVALFKHHAEINRAKSATAGRPVYDDVEVVEIRRAGSRDFGVYPATSFCDWVTDPETGEPRRRTYAERFARQYRQFKEQTAQTKSGTPLTHVPFLTEARRAELRALNIYTLEALAHIDGQELKNLGPYGRELKNKAEEYIAEASRGAPSIQLQAELEALRARNQALEQDNQALKTETGDDLGEMTDEQLKAYITTNSGVEPQGNLNRKTLLRMAASTGPAKQMAAAS